jgi:hypothetical protein
MTEQLTEREQKIVLANMEAKLPFCQGCRNNFYNQGGNSQSGRCWSLQTAKVVTRFRIGWWTAPTAPGAYTEVETLDCHHATGQYSMQKELPTFCVEPNRKAKR